MIRVIEIDIIQIEEICVFSSCSVTTRPEMNRKFLLLPLNFLVIVVLLSYNTVKFTFYLLDSKFGKLSCYYSHVEDPLRLL